MWWSVVFLAFVAGALAAPRQEERLELVIVNTTTPEQVRFLASFQDDVELDFWVHPQLNSWTWVALPWSRHEDVTRRWTAAGMVVKVKEQDVQELVERVEEQSRIFQMTQNNSALFNSGLRLVHTTYYTDFLPLLRTLRDSYPSLVFFDETGSTPARPRSQEDGLIIDVIELGANRGSTPVIMLEVMIHAREHITGAANLYFMDWVLANYGSDADATFLLNNFHFVILPQANPDGYVYSRASSANRLWRKNRGRNSGSTCRGTDLNRNFNIQWSLGSTSACSDTYRGSGAESEAETQAVVNVFRYFKSRIVAYSAVHCFSQLLLLPYSYTSNINAAGARPPNTNKHTGAASAMQTAMRAATGLHYTYGLPVQMIGYAATGSSGDWAIHEGDNKILSIAYELRPDRNDVTTTAGFILDASHIIPTGREYTASIIAWARYIVQNGTE